MINWIYNLTDYRQVFALTEQDLQKSILDYPSGISSVNAELYALGYRMVSGDPDYHLSTKDMEDKAWQILQSNIDYLHQHLDILSTTLIPPWQRSTELFLTDYALGKQQGRYQVMESVAPPANEPAFELLLCTDLVFSLNASVQSAVSAQELMNKLCQLAIEMRIFPLPEQKNAIAAELGPIMLAFQQRNFGVEIRAVNYPLRRDANAMLRVWAKECEVNS